MAVIAAVLEGQVPEEDRDLLQDDVAKFKVRRCCQVLYVVTYGHESNAE